MTDPQHGIVRIGAAPGEPPLVELLGKVGGGLSAQRGIAVTRSFAQRPVTIGAGGKPARRIAAVIEASRDARRGGLHGRFGSSERQVRIIAGHCLLLARRHLARDRFHLGMAPTAARIALELRGEIPLVEPGKPRGAGTIPAAVQPVAGDAGMRCAAVSAAERDQLAGCGETIGRALVDRAARGGQHGEHGDKGASGSFHDTRSNPPGRTSVPSGPISSPPTVRAFGFSARCLILPLLMLAGCKPPPGEVHHMPQADAARGHAAILRAGCAACHAIPGVRWPRGAVGPALEGFAAQGLIAGRLPNRPDLLARFVRDAPATVPGSTMPAMPISEGEARDIAAYLYASGRR